MLNLNEEREGRDAHLSETVIHRQAVAVCVASKDTVSVVEFSAKGQVDPAIGSVSL